MAVLSFPKRQSDEDEGFITAWLEWRRNKSQAQNDAMIAKLERLEHPSSQCLAIARAYRLKEAPIARLR